MAYPDGVAAQHGDLAGAHHLLDTQGTQQLEQAFDLVFGAGDLHDDRVRADIHDAGAEDGSQVGDLGALLGGGGFDFDQSQVAQLTVGWLVTSCTSITLTSL
jgi:hypothetical protein